MSKVILKGNSLRGVDITVHPRKSLILNSHEAALLEDALHTIRVAAKRGDLQYYEVTVQ